MQNFLHFYFQFFLHSYNIINKEIAKNSREKSLAITKLEEAQFWAIKGITREEN